MFISPNKQDLINQQSTEIRGISLKSETTFALPGVDIDNQLKWMKRIQKGALQMVLYDYEFDYKTLLQKTNLTNWWN